MDISEYENDPRLFLFTSLTAGSSHIITATSRLETILKANKIPFQAIDLATDEKARRLWQRRGQKKKLPGLVKDGFVLGDLEEIEEWNEFGELKENIGPVPASNAAPAGSRIQGVSTAPAIDHNVPVSQQNTSPVASKLIAPIPPPSAEEARIALPGAAEIAALNKAKKEKEAAAIAATKSSPAVAETPSTVQASGPEEKAEEASSASATVPIHHPSIDHLSAPASAIQSGTATPQNIQETAAGVAPTPEVAQARLTHRGSEVKEASPEEIRKLETENALAEVTDESDSEEVTTAAVKGLTINEAGDAPTQSTENADDDKEKDS